MDISIVIPVFNESRKIEADIKAAAAFLQKNSLMGEIIVVDDGSYDKTSKISEKAEISPDIDLKVERCSEHHGKGFAVRVGMKKAEGDYIMFVDSGGCSSYEDAPRGLELIKNGDCEIIHGSRKFERSIIRKPQSFLRQVYSAMFNRFVKVAMKVPKELTDTQCGFKIYKREVAKQLYNQCVTNGFMFDIEIILRAEKHGFRIKEIPIEWSCDRDSRLSPIKNLWGILRELINIKRIL